MSKQASLRKELESDELLAPDLLDRIYDDLNDIVGETSSYVRVERDFSGNDVFVQTEDYNVFITRDGVTFHGLERGSNVFNDTDTVSGEVLDYVENIYEEDDLEKELKWY